MLAPYPTLRGRPCGTISHDSFQGRPYKTHLNPYISKKACVERGIRGRLGFCQGLLFLHALFKSSRVEVPQAEASSVLARIEDLQAEFDHETFPQSSSVSISWEQKFEIGEGMFENFGLAKLSMWHNLNMHTVQRGVWTTAIAWLPDPKACIHPSD